MKTCSTPECTNTVGKGMKGDRCRVCIWSRFQDSVINKIDATGSITGSIDVQPKKRGSTSMITPEATVTTSVDATKTLTNRQIRKARGFARTFLRNSAKGKALTTRRTPRSTLWWRSPGRTSRSRFRTASPR